MFDRHAGYQNAVLDILVSRAPNGIRFETFQRKLPHLALEEILNATNSLVLKGLVSREEFRNSFTGQILVFIKLAEPSKYPIRHTIKIGSQEFPRFMQGDMAGAEDVNEPLEALAEYVQDLEKRFVQISNEQTQRYWGNTITLFGLFLAVFTLILSAIPKIQIDSTWSFEQVLWLNTATILPQFIVLVVFVIALRLIFRRQ